jgi:hypothetical protein
VYTGAGTFSLPVALPEGQLQIDFTKPGGDAELSVWVVSERIENGAYSTAGVLAVALAALVFWLIVRFIARRLRPRRPAGPYIVPAAGAR